MCWKKLTPGAFMKSKYTYPSYAENCVGLLYCSIVSNKQGVFFSRSYIILYMRLYVVELSISVYPPQVYTIGAWHLCRSLSNTFAISFLLVPWPIQLAGSIVRKEAHKVQFMVMMCNTKTRLRGIFLWFFFFRPSFYFILGSVWVAIIWEINEHNQKHWVILIPSKSFSIYTV